MNRSINIIDITIDSIDLTIDCIDLSNPGVLKNNGLILSPKPAVCICHRGHLGLDHLEWKPGELEVARRISRWGQSSSDWKRGVEGQRSGECVRRSAQCCMTDCTNRC